MAFTFTGGTLIMLWLFISLGRFLLQWNKVKSRFPPNKNRVTVRAQRPMYSDTVAYILVYLSCTYSSIEFTPLDVYACFFPT